MQKTMWRLVLVCGVLLGCFVVVLNMVQPVNLATLKEYSSKLQSSVQVNPWWSTVVYLCLYSIDGALALPFSMVLTLAGGFLFGMWYGAFFAALGATIGATICFLIVRYICKEACAKYLGSQFSTLKSELATHGILYLLALRFFIFIPSTLINIMCAFLPISLWTFVASTFFGILPGVVVFAYAGQSLSTLESVEDIVSWPILGAFCALATLSLLSILVQKWFTKS